MFRMREYRKRTGLTMKQLGEIVGASEASISQYETGRVEPDMALLCKIADALGVSVDSLLGRDGAEEIIDNETVPEIHLISTAMKRMTKQQQNKTIEVLRAVFKDQPEIFNKEA